MKQRVMVQEECGSWMINMIRQDNRAWPLSSTFVNCIIVTVDKLH